MVGLRRTDVPVHTLRRNAVRAQQKKTRALLAPKQLDVCAREFSVVCIPTERYGMP
jgi:hypothetical protein